jgi:protein associated with RNAse G/E
MIYGRDITVKSLKYDNSVRKSWSARLVENVEDSLVLEGTFHNDVEHGELGRIEKGTVSVEYYCLSGWYSIFRFLTPHGKLRNYYCNVNMPPILEGSTLSYVDLDLDVVVWPDGKYKVLDIEEFEENSSLFAYPASVKQRALQALDELIELASRRKLPG